VPILLAEGDRDAYRRQQAAFEREKEIMKDVKGWEVSRNDPRPPPLGPRRSRHLSVESVILNGSFRLRRRFSLSFPFGLCVCAQNADGYLFIAVARKAGLPQSQVLAREHCRTIIFRCIDYPSSLSQKTDGFCPLQCALLRTVSRG
jgi:hypothetical protein